MTRTSHILFQIASMAMDVSCIYAWIAFSLELLNLQQYPLVEAVFVFLLTSIGARLVRGRGWRVFQVLLLHGSVLLFFILRNIYMLRYSSEAFWSHVWLVHFFNRELTFNDWTILVVFWCWTFVLWISGIGYTHRSSSYSNVCSRFDRCLTWLFSLLFVKLILVTKTNVQLTDNVSERLVFSFYIFGILAVALAHNRSRRQRRFVKGYAGVGLIVCFSSAIILCAVGLVLLFLPYLQVASETSYTALIAVGNPIASVLANILLYILGLSKGRSKVLNIASKKKKIVAFSRNDSIRGLHAFSLIYLHVLRILFVLLFVLLIGVGAWYLWRWLTSKTQRHKRNEGELDRLYQWFADHVAYLYRFFIRLFVKTKVRESILLYRALLRWGRRSGLPNRFSETPLEYGYRLKQHFVTVGEEIDQIIFYYNRCVYGQTPNDESNLAQARRALRKLQSPIQWPKRLRLLVSTRQNPQNPDRG